MHKAVLITDALVHTTAGINVTSVLVEGDVIQWLGQTHEAEQISGVERISAQGMWLAPAFADAHVHVTDTGLRLNGLDLSTVRNTADFAGRFASPSATAVQIAHGWDDTHWDRSPTADDLPANRCVYASRVDSHSAVVSRPLLQAVEGIEQMVGFSPDGRLTADAHGAVRQWAMSRLDAGTRDSAIRSTFRHAVSQGVVALDEMAGPVISGKDDARRIAELASEPGVPQTNLWWGELQGFATASEFGAVGCGGDLFVDGSLGSRTALLSHSYADNESCGRQYLHDDDITSHIVSAENLGMSTGFHAIGDSAIDCVAHAFEAAADIVGKTSLASSQHRIEHCEMPSDYALSVFARLGIIISSQPSFDREWAGPGGMYEQRLGNRANGMNPLAKYSDLGILTILGSDSPVTPLDPWATISAAVSMAEPSARLSMRAAFAAHTRGYWRSRGDHANGEIAIGAAANLALWQVPGFTEQSHKTPRTNWASDPRSRTPALPDLAAGRPECLWTMSLGQILFDRTGEWSA